MTELTAPLGPLLGPLPTGHIYRGADRQVAVGPPSSDPAAGRTDVRHPALRYERWPVVGAAPTPRWGHAVGAYRK